MAERRSVFSRFWPPSASRRTSTTQTAAAPPPATTKTKTPATQSTTKVSSPPAPATQPKTEPRKASPEPSKSPDSKDQPKTSSPSRASTRSPSSSKPASPSRLSAQSRSPPQPPSSSNAAPQARSTLPSPSRITTQIPSTPKQTSKPPSPSRLTSRSPKQGPSSSSKGKQPASPSNDSTQPTENISTSSKENDPKPTASQQEAVVKEEVKPDSRHVANRQTQDGASFKNGDVEAKPSQLSELGNIAPPAQGLEARQTSKSMDSSTVNGGEHEPHIKRDAKPAETQDVKEVVQETNTEANEKTKKKVDESAAPESVSEAQIVEKAEIPSEKKQEAPDTKQILATKADVAASQSTKKSKNTGARDKSALPKGEHVPLHKNIRADVSKFANQLAVGDHKNAISDKPVSVITLAGENRGATMHMESDSAKREGRIHIHRSYKVNPDESPEATTDEEDSSRGKNSEDESSLDDQLTEAYVNNNSQAINNSIVFNSSITEGSPGVHLVVSHLPTESIRSKDETSLPQTRKAEVNTSHAEKLTYQPTIRRRCLRGLLMETSDSDSENPEKPQRHGCRVSCQKENM